jgi:hypothetical protein
MGYSKNEEETMNSDKVLAYTTFGTSEEFEKWQIDNPDYPIQNINPLLSGMKMSMEESALSGEATTSVVIFVLYWRDKQKDNK